MAQRIKEKSWNITKSIIIMSFIVDAIQLAAKAHKGQKDLLGRPYILHSLAVMSSPSLKTDVEWATAVLHDVVEDTSLSIDDIAKEIPELPREVLTAVEVITKDPHEKYMDYLGRVKSDEIALAVKKADIAHNVSRLDQLPKDRRRSLANKYARAKKFLGISSTALNLNNSERI